MDYHFEDFLIRPAAPVQLKRVRLVYDSSLDLKITPETHEDIDALWDRINAIRLAEQKPPLRDLPLFLPGQPLPAGAGYEIPCGLTSYKEAQCLANPCDNWDWAVGAGLSIVPVCRDGRILVGRRADRVSHGAGQFHVAAGHAHPKPDFKSQPDSLLGGVLEELEEEMNIIEHDIDYLEFIGTGLNRLTAKTEFLTRVFLKQSAEIYMTRWTANRPDDPEFTELRAIDNPTALPPERFTTACRMAVHAHVMRGV